MFVDPDLAGKPFTCERKVLEVEQLFFLAFRGHKSELRKGAKARVINTGKFNGHLLRRNEEVTVCSVGRGKTVVWIQTSRGGFKLPMERSNLRHAFEPFFDMLWSVLTRDYCSPAVLRLRLEDLKRNPAGYCAGVGNKD